MSGFMTEELLHRFNWMRDEQARTNSALEARLNDLEAENKDVRNRLTVLTRMLISKQIATAEEIATSLAAISAPVVPVVPTANELEADTPFA